MRSKNSSAEDEFICSSCLRAHPKSQLDESRGRQPVCRECEDWGCR